MTQQNSNNNQNRIDEDEIDLIALAKTLWEGRKIVIKTTLVFIVIGLFVAIFTEKEYSASTTFVPQTEGGKSLGGNLGGLAAMAGINLGGMNSDSGILPSLYPQILNNIHFQKELLQTPLTIEGQKEKVSFASYYTYIYSPGWFVYVKKYTLGLPGLIISAIKGKPIEVVSNSVDEDINLQIVTREENELFKILNKKILLQVKEDDGYVTISSNMPEAIASAEMTLKVQQLLQQYVIDFKIQKSKDQLIFIKSRYLESANKFKDVQQKLADNRDRNKNVVSEMARINNQTLEDEYNLIYNVYSELAKQLENQYIQVTEDTPVFTVLKPVTIPLDKSKPNRVLILFVWTFLGIVIGIGFVFGGKYLSFLKNKWEE